jgi:hypothetical protein
MVFRLPFKIPDPLIRNKKGPQRTIGIVGHKPSGALVEFSSASIGAPGFEHIFARMRVAQLLRHVQILIARDLAKLAAMLRKMLFKQVLRTESPPACPGKRDGQADEDSEGKYPDPYSRATGRYALCAIASQ